VAKPRTKFEVCNFTVRKIFYGV